MSVRDELERVFPELGAGFGALALGGLLLEQLPTPPRGWVQMVCAVVLWNVGVGLWRRLSRR